MNASKYSTQNLPCLNGMYVCMGVYRNKIRSMTKFLKVGKYANHAGVQPSVIWIQVIF